MLDGTTRRHPNTYTADELHRALVGDAVAGLATPLDWAVAAYARIGRLRRVGADRAFEAVAHEVEVVRGIPGMPV